MLEVDGSGAVSAFDKSSALAGDFAEFLQVKRSGDMSVFSGGSAAAGDFDD